MLIESENVELKEILTDDIGREVIAFANTLGGIIYIGINDKGDITGVKEIEKTYSSLTNMVRDCIVPDITLFVKYELLENNVIKITVDEGTAKPYYLKKNGIKPSGVYVRQGTSSVQATWEKIRKLIKQADGDSFEAATSIMQNFTFTSAQKEFNDRNIIFSEDKFVSLGLVDAQKGLFTNLALIVSDQCSHSVKVAVFEDVENTIFIDRREFKGSIFKQLHDTFDYLMLNNRTVSDIRGLTRYDSTDYPFEAIREALLNALIHRDYGYSGSIIVNINRERMEFISIGGLLPGLSAEDIKNGISQPRNPYLAQIFFRLKHIEAYGTGIRRIFRLYKDFNISPSINITENSFRITLPNMNFNRPIDEIHAESRYIKMTDQMQKIIAYLQQHNEITDDEIMKLLDIKTTRAYVLTKQMCEMGLIDKIGYGNIKRYVLNIKK